MVPASSNTLAATIQIRSPSPLLAVSWPPSVTSCKYWDEIRRDIKRIYTADNANAARSAFDEFTEKWASATRRSSGSGTTRGASQPMTRHKVVISKVRYLDRKTLAFPPQYAESLVPVIGNYVQVNIHARRR